MSIKDLSTDLHQALEFAESEFAKGTRFWPRLLVRCLENAEKSKAFGIVKQLYTRRFSNEENLQAKSWLLELRGSPPEGGNSVDGARLRKRATDIWGDPHCRSLICRGLTRLFTANAFLCDGNISEYEIELTRAMSMLAASGNKSEDEREFKKIICSILQEVKR